MQTPTALGLGAWVRSNPLRTAFVLVRHAPQGRQQKTASGRRTRAKKIQAGCPQRACAVAAGSFDATRRLADWPAKRLVRVY
jgi:hypothetical protein